MQARELPLLIESASAHGVLPAVARNLRGLAETERGHAVLHEADAQSLLAGAIDDLHDRLVLLTGKSLLLSGLAARIAEAVAQRALPASVMKGPVFARRLYPQAADRSFTDIDFLVEPTALAEVFTVLERLGFVLVPGRNRDDGEQKEFKWNLPGSDHVLIEVQTDLIHSPNLGAAIQLRHADLLAAGDGDTEDATALLLAAAVHGAAGHQFDRLQPTIDILQAVRGAAGPIDRNRLAVVARATGSTVALQAALDLVARLFDEPEAAELANALSPAPWRQLRRRLVSPAVVLRSQSHRTGRDSWRRQALREIIRRTGKTTTQPVAH